LGNNAKDMGTKPKEIPTLYAKKWEFVTGTGDARGVWGKFIGRYYEENSVRNEAKRENKKRWR